MDVSDLIIRFGKSCDTVQGFKSKPFVNLPFGLIKIELPDILVRGDLDEILTSVISPQNPQLNIKKIPINEKVAFVLWVREQMLFIQQIEKQYLSQEPDPELIASGVSRLDEFGVLVTIDHLANGNILNYEKIKNLPYYEVYQKLKLDKIQGEIKRSYEKIILKKHK